MIELDSMKSFAAVMRDANNEEVYFDNMEEALKAEKEGMKLIACTGKYFHK